jgi:hypothetical protein
MQNYISTQMKLSPHIMRKTKTEDAFKQAARRIFGPKSEEATGGRRKLHNLYSSPNSTK